MAENKKQPTQQPKHSQIWKNILGGESSVDILEAYNLTQRNVRENSPPNHQICDTEFVGLGGCWGIWVNTLSSSIIKYNLSKIWEIVSSFLKSTLSFYWKVHRKNKHLLFFWFQTKKNSNMEIKQENASMACMENDDYKLHSIAAHGGSAHHPM